MVMVMVMVVVMMMMYAYGSDAHENSEQSNIFYFCTASCRYFLVQQLAL